MPAISVEKAMMEKLSNEYGDTFGGALEDWADSDPEKVLQVFRDVAAYAALVWHCKLTQLKLDLDHAAKQAQYFGESRDMSKVQLAEIQDQIEDLKNAMPPDSLHGIQFVIKPMQEEETEMAAAVEKFHQQMLDFDTKAEALDAQVSDLEDYIAQLPGDFPGT